MIPSIAVRQAEVLRDGAAAQYGSDAIAGVMNFQLKDAPSGGSLEFRTGAFRDANPGDTSTCGTGILGDIQHSCNGIGGRGQAFTVAGNTGLPLGASGFANLSFEYGESAPTSRSVQRTGAQNIIATGNTNLRNPAQVWGAPRREDDLKLFGNFGHLFANDVQVYGHTNYAGRTVTGGFYFRNPHTRGGVFRGPVVDGTPTLLVGDRVWAATGVEGAGGCPTIPIIDNVPDAAALAAVEAGQLLRRQRRVAAAVQLHGSGGHEDTNGISINANKLTHNGATIVDAADSTKNAVPVRLVASRM